MESERGIMTGDGGASVHALQIKLTEFHTEKRAGGR